MTASAPSSSNGVGTVRRAVRRVWSKSSGRRAGPLTGLVRPVRRTGREAVGRAAPRRASRAVADGSAGPVGRGGAVGSVGVVVRARPCGRIGFQEMNVSQCLAHVFAVLRSSSSRLDSCRAPETRQAFRCTPNRPGGMPDRLLDFRRNRWWETRDPTSGHRVAGCFGHARRRAGGGAKNTTPGAAPSAGPVSCRGGPSAKCPVAMGPPARWPVVTGPVVSPVTPVGSSGTASASCPNGSARTGRAYRPGGVAPHRPRRVPRGAGRPCSRRAPGGRRARRW